MRMRVRRTADHGHRRPPTNGQQLIAGHGETMAVGRSGRRTARYSRCRGIVYLPLGENDRMAVPQYRCRTECLRVRGGDGLELEHPPSKNTPRMRRPAPKIRLAGVSLAMLPPLTGSCTFLVSLYEGNQFSDAIIMPRTSSISNDQKMESRSFSAQYRWRNGQRRL